MDWGACDGLCWTFFSVGTYSKVIITRMKVTLYLPLIIFLILGIFFFRALQHDPKILPSALIGQAMPSFTLPTLDNSKLISQQDLPKERFLLNVWASWCHSCAQDHEAINNFAAHNNLKIVGLNYKDDVGSAQNWLQQKHNPYAMIIFDNNGELALDLGVYGVPETFYVENNIIKKRVTGPLSADKLQELIA